MSRKNRRGEGTTSSGAGVRMADPREGNSHSTGQGPEAQGGEGRDAADGQGYFDPTAVPRLVSRAPVTAIAAGFGVGFGLGLLAVAVLRRREEQHWYEQWLPHSIDEVSEGVKQLPSKVAEYIPRSMRWR